MRSSVVERFPDKKEVHSPILCAPTDMGKVDFVHDEIKPGMAELDYVNWYNVLICLKQGAEFQREEPSPELIVQLDRLLQIYPDAKEKSKAGQGRFSDYFQK